MDKPKILTVLDLGKSPYGSTWELQKNLHTRRLQNEIGDTLILVEHFSVYTLGKNADAHHLLASKEYLKSRGIELFKVDRGGDITYHGPGQLVGYPIFNLKEHRESVGWFVNTIEEVLIRTLSTFGIQAARLPHLTGVWVGENKIAAIGMRVSRWVTMHGFALNVSTDLSYYSGIIPCGIASKGVTRMLDLNPAVEWQAVQNEVIKQFVELFGFENFILTKTTN